MTTTVLAYLPSPSQGIWFLGPVPIRAYALCIIVGIVAALIIGDRRWEARGGERGVIYDIALWAVPFGLIGGRLYHVMTDWRTYFGDEGKGLAAAFQVWEGGLGIWGAVALGGVGAWIACRRRGIPLPAFGDAIAPGIILAQGIGRLGNYFNQELYGRATTLPWGLEIYDRRDAAGFRDDLNGVSNGEVLAVVHPTFLYELLWNLLIFAVLLWADRRFKLGHGRLFALYVAGYCVGRFWVELMRSDVATHLAGIRINTFTATFVFIGAVVYIMLAPKGREDPASLAGKPDEGSVLDEVGAELTAVAATTGVVAAAKVAGEDDADHMHIDEVTDDESANAAAAIELKALAPKPGKDEAEDDADEAEPAESDTEESAEVAEAESEQADDATEVDVEAEAEVESAEPVVEADVDEPLEESPDAADSEPAEPTEDSADEAEVSEDQAEIEAADGEEAEADAEPVEVEVEVPVVDAVESEVADADAEESPDEAEVESDQVDSAAEVDVEDEAEVASAEPDAEADADEPVEPVEPVEPSEASADEADVDTDEPVADAEVSAEAADSEVAAADAEPVEDQEAEVAAPEAEESSQDVDAEQDKAEGAPDAEDADQTAETFRSDQGRLRRWLRGRRDN